MIDFIITSCRDKTLDVKIRQNHNRQGTSKPTKLNAAKLSTISHKESFVLEIEMAGGKGSRLAYREFNLSM